MLADFFYSYKDLSIFFNLFGYISFRAGLSLLFSFLFVFSFMPKWIIIQKKYFPKGQPIRSDGPTTHLIKEGTPALGGILLIISVVLNIILWTNDFSKFNYIIILSFILFGLLGFSDDYLKIKLRKGISTKVKFFFQIIITSFLLFIVNQYIVDLTLLYLPFFKNFSIQLGYFYIIFAIIVIIGSTNAVNLTDGLDGLVSMPLIFVFLTFAVFSYIIGNSIYSDYLLLNYVPSSGQLVIVCASSIGALLAFLWYNSYPAEVFMGDAGSQSFGGSLAIISILLKQEFVLAIAGGLFVIEALSVSIQVIYFKVTKKRFFLMAPIHHHFEKKGIPEQKIVIRFWIIAFIFCLIALSLLKIR
jgi:phospho-N-acetylmuramoyl-pentapeptide-transferase|tara:strand:- start:994 stop:2067 length:1074 start_codon:yes stop_codon:yes gene_type:complete